VCGVAPEPYPKFKRCRDENELLTCLRHSRVLIRFPIKAPGSLHANMFTIARLCEAWPSCLSLRCYIQYIISSAGDQTSFCDPLGLVLYSADWLASCVTKRDPAVHMRTHVRAAEADRLFRVAPVSRQWYLRLKYR
jgi:hypothetical protein